MKAAEETRKKTQQIMSGLSLKHAQQSRRSTLFATAKRLAETDISVAAAREEIKRLYPNVFSDTMLSMQPVGEEVQRALSEARLTLARKYNDPRRVEMFNYAISNNDLNAFTPEITCQAIAFMVEAVGRFKGRSATGGNLAQLFQGERKRLETIHQSHLIAASGANITPTPHSDILSRLLQSWEPTYVGQYDRALRKRCREMATLIDAGQLNFDEAVVTLHAARATAQAAIDASRLDAAGVRKEEMLIHSAEEAAKAIAAIDAARPAAEQREAIRQESLRRQKAENERLRQESRSRLDREEPAISGKVRELMFDKNGVLIGAKFAGQEKEPSSTVVEVAAGSTVSEKHSPQTAAPEKMRKRPSRAAIAFARQEPKYAEVKIRPNQARFRAEVFDNCGGRCVISGDNYALQAAHLVPWSSGGIDSWDNGLLLRSDLHFAFDNGLLAIDPATLRVHVKPGVSCLHYDGVTITAEINTNYLQASWEAFGLSR